MNNNNKTLKSRQIENIQKYAMCVRVCVEKKGMRQSNKNTKKLSAVRFSTQPYFLRLFTR